MMEAKTMISPYILKDFIYEEAIPQNEGIKALIQVLAISKGKAMQVLNIMQDEVKQLLEKIYVSFIDSHKSLKVDTNSELTKEVVSYFYIRLNKEIQQFVMTN